LGSEEVKFMSHSYLRILNFMKSGSERPIL